MSTGLFIFLTPFITGAIGWLTNHVAIRMLFHPRRPVRVFFWSWQGLIPRRQNQLAAEAAEIIEREILQQHKILHEIRRIELGPSLEEAAHRLVWKRVGPRFRSIPLIGPWINDTTLAKLEAIIAREMKSEATGMMEKIATQFEASVNLKQMIEENIAAFDLDRLETIVTGVARNEFRTIERLGAVLGFLIGCIQLLLFRLLGAAPF